jgi:hypothetical protein
MAAFIGRGVYGGIRTSMRGVDWVDDGEKALSGLNEVCCDSRSVVVAVCRIRRLPSAKTSYSPLTARGLHM